MAGAEQPHLKRAFSLPYLVLYGLGTTLGAGIYVLIGEVVVEAGALAPLAFLVAATVAGFTALSFGEFSSRHPESAGEAVYVSAGFSVSWLPLVVGLTVVAAGIVSSAALGRGVAGYVDPFVTVPDTIAILVAVLLLGATAVAGIQESIIVLTIMTVVEAGALVVLIALGIFVEPAGPAVVQEVPAVSNGAVFGVLGAAALAFYAFIGFEDMVNVAEEVQDAPRTLPIAIIIVLVVTVVIYGGVSMVAANARHAVDFANEGAPLAALFNALSGAPPQIIAGVGLIAVANGILIQIIMASRVLYGLGKRNLLPAALAEIHPRTQTPAKATLLVAAVVLLLALTLDVATLAQVTSTLILAVFATVNLSLIRVKLRGKADTPTFEVPLAIPVIGCVTAAAFAVYSAADLFFL